MRLSWEQTSCPPEAASDATRELPSSAPSVEVSFEGHYTFSAWLSLWKQEAQDVLVVLYVQGLVWFLSDPLQRGCNLPGELALCSRVLLGTLET